MNAITAHQLKPLTALLYKNGNECPDDYYETGESLAAAA